MKRSLIATVGVGIFLALVGVLYIRQAIALPPESVELPVPTMSPSVITPNIPTFVTVTASLPDLNSRSPRLQYLDLIDNTWKNLGTLRDNGRAPDGAKKDRVFFLRLRLTATGTATEIAIVRNGRVKIKDVSQSPVEFRLAARKKVPAGTAVSPPLTMPVASVVPLTIGNATGGLAVSISVPQTMDDVRVINNNHLYLQKTGPEGYEIKVDVLPKPASQPLYDWIITQSDFTATEASSLVATAIAGLLGYQLDSSEEGGHAVDIWLDDPLNNRLFVFSITSNGGVTADHLTDNLSEALSIIGSLQP